MGNWTDGLEVGMKIRFYTDDDGLEEKYQRFIGEIGEITGFEDEGLFPIHVDFGDDEFYISPEEIACVIGDKVMEYLVAPDESDLIGLFAG